MQKSLFSFALLASALASASNSVCEARFRPEVVQWTQDLNDVSDRKIAPDAYLVKRRPAPTTVDMRTSLLTHQLVLKVADEIESQSAKMLTEFLYVVRDETAVPGSSANSNEREIPARVVSAMCLDACGKDEKDSFRKIAIETLNRLKSEGVARKTLREITEDVQTHAQGLLQVAEAMEAKKTSLADLHVLFQQISLEPTGKLLATRSLRVFPLELENLKLVVSRIDQTQIRQAIGFFYQEFQTSRAESRQDWAPVSKAFSTGRNLLLSTDDESQMNAFAWLARLLESAPVSVAKVVNADPALQNEMCEILSGLDTYLFRTQWKKSFSSLWDGIKIPLWVVGLTIVPVLTVGAPLAILWAGVLVLKATSFYGIWNGFNTREEIARKQRAHLHGMLNGVASVDAVNTFNKYEQKKIAAESDIMLSIAFEVGSLGFAKVVTKKTWQKFHALSESDLVAILARQMSKKTSYSLRDLIRSKVPEVARPLKGRWTLEMNDMAKLKQLVKTTPRADLEKIYFGSKDFGFGRTLFLTEAGVDLSTTVYQAATQDYFSEISPFSHLFGQ